MKLHEARILVEALSTLSALPTLRALPWAPVAKALKKAVQDWIDSDADPRLLRRVDLVHLELDDVRRQRAGEAEL